MLRLPKGHPCRQCAVRCYGSSMSLEVPRLQLVLLTQVTDIEIYQGQLPAASSTRMLHTSRGWHLRRRQHTPRERHSATPLSAFECVPALPNNVLRTCQPERHGKGYT